MNGRDVFQMEDHVYLRNLADRLMRIPASYGVDQADVDRLLLIASESEDRETNF